MSSEKIIVIDDEKRMCDSLEALLHGDGYRVSSFQSPKDAVEAIRREKIDLVISDIKMAGLDGLEILKIVKEIDEGIPVILMTGYASLNTALDAIAQGAYDYLLKPVEFTYLELSVRRALEKRRAELSRLALLEELKLSNLILQRRIGELNALYEAGKSIGSSANLSELLRQIVILAAAVTEARVGSIMLLDERKQYLTIEAAIGLDDDVVRKTRLPIGASIAGFVAKTGEAMIVADVENEPRFKRINNEKYGAASLLCTPLRIKNDILGVINMANKQEGGAFTSNDLRLLTTFASQAAVAVDDAWQFEKSRRRLVEFEILHEIASELPTFDSLLQFRQALISKLKRIFPIDYAFWFSYDPANQLLVPEGAVGQTDLPLTDSGRINLAKMPRHFISFPEVDLSTFNLDDITQLSLLMGEKLAQNPHYPKPKEAFMAIPVLRNGELAYLYYLGADLDRAYSEDDFSLAKLVISQAALLFEKEKAMLNATRLITMGNMISEISHDLRKPLTSIRGGLQILQERHPDLMGGSQFFSSMEEEIHRMNELVRELVDFSNPNKYETSKLDLRTIVGRAAELVAPELRRHQIAFHSEFAETNWEVIANKNQLLEVFLNLCLNAIDAMPNGGTLTIQGLIERPEHKKTDYLAVKVIDTGCGIKKEDLSRIFERYYTTKETGTGLGLVVVERIISAHTGTLQVTSVEGKGTIFTVYLPIHA